MLENLELVSPIHELEFVPLSFRPEPGESFNGFLMRVVEENCLSGILTLGQLAGVKAPKPTYHLTELKRLAWAAGVDLTKLNFDDAVTCRPNVALNRTDVRRICVECLKGEKRFHRGIWNQRNVRTCYIHSTRLLSECPNCRASLKWTGASLSICSGCLEDLTAAPSEIVSRNDFRGSELLCTGQTPGFSESELSILDGLRISTITKLTEEFSRLNAVVRGSGCPESDPTKSWMYKDATDPWLERWITAGVELMTAPVEDILDLLGFASRTAPRLVTESMLSVREMCSYYDAPIAFDDIATMILADLK